VSQRPHRVRTWSPRGQTPILQYSFNWDKISVAAGITFHNFYFRLYKGSIKTAEVIDFLQAVLRHIRGPLTIVWDRLSAHKSKATRDFIASQGERLVVEYLPPYAPELNPVEYIWAYWKHHTLPNVCPKDYWSLDETARKTLKRMRRRPRLITAFWHQAELSF
jgi:transposase